MRTPTRESVALRVGSDDPPRALTGTSPRPSSLDAALLAALERSFARLAGEDACIDAQEFKTALGLRSDYLAERVLRRFDRDGDGLVRRDEFLEGVRRLVFGTDREKLQFVFALHDHDGNGTLGQDELFRMIAISLAEADVRTERSISPERLAAALMSAADRDRDGRITFDEFEAVVTRSPALLRDMTRSEALWIAPNEDLLARVTRPLSPAELRRRRLRHLTNNLVPAAFFSLFALLSLGLFAAVFFDDPAENAFVSLGRAAGVGMKFTGALILVPVLRKLLTRVRASRLRKAVPVDEAIVFHRVAGHTLFSLALLHAGGFIAAHLIGHPSLPLGALLLGTLRGGTGLALLGVLGVMWFFARDAIRRTRHFELFYFTHLLYVVWFALAFVHAPAFIPWALPALVGFAIESHLRRKRHGRRVLAVAHGALRSGVTRLDLQRPEGFAFSPGDYVFLRIPAVARHEWHPFTLSSAPENDALTVHVRSLGNWTTALRRLVERRETHEGDGPLEVFVDGPFGSPSAHIFDAEYAVFVGAGIGVTPFASVLESLALRARGSRSHRLRKVHFFWLNRDQYSFEWFVQLLTDLERSTSPAILDMQLYMTGGRADSTALGLEMAREVTRAGGAPDVVTGLRTRTHMGPPDWDAALGAIAREHEGQRVDVFFCGPPGLATKVRAASASHGMPFRQEDF